MQCPRCGQWAPDLDAACAACGAPLGAAAAAGPVDGGAMTALPALRYAGFWRRLAGVLFDAAVLFFPNAIVRSLLGLSVVPWNSDDPGSRIRLALTFEIALGWLWCAVWESSPAQASPGQQLLGLRVADLAGRRISFGRATGRYFARIVSVLMCGTGFLFNLWTPRRQTVHDLISGCVVLRPEPARAAPAPAAAELPVP